MAIVSIQDTPAAAIGGMTGGNSSQSIANTTIGAGPNITGSLSLRNMLAKTAGSAVHLSLANASTIAERSVGPNSHALSVRIGVVRGFVVYIALVADINHGIHKVLVDAGNGKVLRSTQLADDDAARVREYQDVVYAILYTLVGTAGTIINGIRLT